MNEDLKNIEICLPEDILAEVANVPTDEQFRSLVEESFDPLQQQALQQAGYDAYVKVSGTHRPYTFTSQVAQMKSNLILLLRHLWRFPFGRGTLRSLADMWSHYISRLQGNETYGIPSRLDQLTDLPSAPALLSDRTISGVPEAADGMSLVHLVCNTATLSEITELTDKTRGWTMDRDLFYQSTIKKATFGFKRLEIASNKVTNFFVSSNLEELHLPDATYIGFTNGSFSSGGKFLQDSANLRVLDFPVLETYYVVGGDGGAHGLWNIKGSDVMVFPKAKAFYNSSNAYTIYNWTECRVLKFPVMETIPSIANATWLYGMPALEELHIPMFKKVSSKTGGWPIMISGCPLLRKTVFGTIEDNLRQTLAADSIVFNNCPQMIHFEIGDGVSVTFTLNLWNPTMALRTDTTAGDYVDLREEGSTAANNLEQFLSNFQTYIADRLADMTGQTALTLTLSAAVYDALQAQEG